jgi:transcription antitermination factor NusG
MDKTSFLAETSWYAVLTRSRQEKVASSMLDGLGIPNFLPLVRETRQWSDRKQVVSVPLFPGYLFVRILLCELQLHVLRVPGVVTFIGNQNGPQAIPDAEIDSVRTVLSRRVQCTPCSIPKFGDRVRIVRGLLAGIEGTLVRSGQDTNLVISVAMIQQSIAIHVDGSDVEPTVCP